MRDADEPPRAWLEPDPDDFRVTLEQNPLARWWRARAGLTGETGSRRIARDRRPAPAADPGLPGPNDQRLPGSPDPRRLPGPTD